LFFDRSGPTNEIWYYEQPLPEGRKNYTKTQPLQYEEFADCIAWWKDRTENDRAWKLTAHQVLEYNPEGRLVSVNLDVKNPNGKADSEHLPPAQLVEDIIAKERKILEILAEIKAELGADV
jgi:type I restriction enzyme M protein